MSRVLSILIGYFFGCIQTSYIYGKLVAKQDIRQHGSGNAGTTNTIRVLGLKAGILVFVCDILKAVLAFSLCMFLFNGSFNFWGNSISGGEGVINGIYAGLGVILGHNFPFYMKFKGGKGIASMVGLILALDIRIGLIVYFCGILSIVFTKYISLASLIIAGFLPFLLLLFGYSLEIVGLGFLLMGLAYYLHRGNIQRLLSGNERKFSLKKS